MEVVIIISEVEAKIYKGVVQGTVTSPMLFSSVYNINRMGFSIKLDEEIKEVPKDLFVIISSYLAVLVREGDKLLVDGVIKKKHLQRWNNSRVWMHAESLYNATLSYGID